MRFQLEHNELKFWLQIQKNYIETLPEDKRGSQYEKIIDFLVEYHTSYNDLVEEHLNKIYELIKNKSPIYRKAKG